MRIGKFVVLLAAGLALAGCDEIYTYSPLTTETECLLDRAGIVYVLNSQQEKIAEAGMALPTPADANPVFQMKADHRGMSERGREFGELLESMVAAYNDERHQMTDDMQSRLYMMLVFVLASAEERQKKEKLPPAEHELLWSDAGRFTAFILAMETNPVPTKRYMFERSADCSTETLRLDPKSVSTKDYERAEDKELFIRSRKIRGFDNIYTMQALIRDEHGGKYVYSFLIPIERGKLFKMYSIRGGEIVVMALHGHVYYPDWQPDGGKNPGPFEAITKEGGELVKKGDELGDAEKAKYEDIFFESVMEWRNPPSGSPVDWAKHFMFGTKTSTYLMKAAQPDWLERLAALIDKIERGEVIMSEKMKTDLQVNYLQFE